jgi:hypothetical protein
MDVVEADTFTRYPTAFEALAGLSPAAFSELVSEVRPAFYAAEEARLDRPDRQRAPGAGRKAVLTIADQLLLALIKSRFFAGWEVGMMFGVGQGTTTRITRRVLPLLEASSVARMIAPLQPDERKKQFLRAVRCVPNHGGILQLLGRACGLYIDEAGRVHPYNRVTACSALPEYDLGTCTA